MNLTVLEVKELVITGAQALMKSLQAQNVEVVFGYPGGAVLPIYDAFLDADIKHILTRHEQGAVHAASGYARATGKPGVALATSGPGATNLVTGIATAYMDSIPLIIITGQVSTCLVGTDAFQEVDITGITIPITKYNYLVKNVEDLPRVIAEAFHIATTGRPGPVLVDIPKNISDAEIDFALPEEVVLRGYKPTYYGHPSQIKHALQFLKQAKAPLIMCGGGVISSGATAKLVEIAERLQIPVVSTLMGIGGFPAEHELYIGMLGLHGLPVANLAVSNCDCLVGIGVRFDDRVTVTVEKFAPNAQVIHIDIDPAEIGKNVRAQVPIVGDIKNVLSEMYLKAEELRHDEWLDQIRKWQVENTFYHEQDRLTPTFVLKCLNELKNEDTIVTTDVGQHQMWAAQILRFAKPRTFISSGGLGTMGYGFPAAIGAQIGAPDKIVVAVTGDGSFQMALGEMGTAMQEDLPIKILLFNNNALGLVKQLQHFYSGQRYSSVHIKGNPDFVALAKSYGAEGLRISNKEEVVPALREALTNGKLTIIECIVGDNELVYPMVLNGKGLHEMEFE